MELDDAKKLAGVIIAATVFLALRRLTW